MDSYCTAEQATAYFDKHLHAAAWTAATDTQRAAALAQATRIIDRQAYRGTKTHPDQARAFPRYPANEVPQAVIDATCEVALALLDSGDSPRRKLQAEGVTAVSIGSVSESYAPGAGRELGAGLQSNDARELLRPWLLGSVGIR